MNCGLEPQILIKHLHDILLFKLVELLAVIEVVHVVADFDAEFCWELVMDHEVVDLQDLLSIGKLLAIKVIT